MSDLYNVIGELSRIAYSVARREAKRSYLSYIARRIPAKSVKFSWYRSNAFEGDKLELDCVLGIIFALKGVFGSGARITQILLQNR
jgi:hypothetical protein